MTQIDSLEQAERVLSRYIPLSKELMGKDLTLTRMQPLMARLGNPEAKLKIIHIAGTSGKTSTAYYVAALLKTAGCKVGLTISPHLVSVTERVQINLQPLSEAVFCAALSEFLELIDGAEQPTYFELLVAFAYWYFAREQVDYAVVETGLGGSFDATNVAGKSDKICVITDVGLDHTQLLGNTLTEIAGQKAGIIHADNQVFMYQQSPAVMAVLKQEAKDKNAILNTLSDNSEGGAGAGFVKNLPEYQQRNWTLAHAVYTCIARRDSLPAPNEKKMLESTKVLIPGRMEVVKAGGKTIILDGAHNQQKVQAFVQSFRHMYPGQKIPVLLALKEGKEYKAVLPRLKPICRRLIVTSYKTAQDLPIRSIDPKIIADAATSLGFEKVVVEPDSKKALGALLADNGEVAVVTGSFYLLSGLRPAILES